MTSQPPESVEREASDEDVAQAADVAWVRQYGVDNEDAPLFYEGFREGFRAAERALSRPASPERPRRPRSQAMEDWWNREGQPDPRLHAPAEPPASPGTGATLRPSDDLSDQEQEALRAWAREMDAECLTIGELEARMTPRAIFQAAYRLAATRSSEGPTDA